MIISELKIACIATLMFWSSVAAAQTPASDTAQGAALTEQLVSYYVDQSAVTIRLSAETYEPTKAGRHFEALVFAGQQHILTLRTAIRAGRLCFLSAKRQVPSDQAFRTHQLPEAIEAFGAASSLSFRESKPCKKPGLHESAAIPGCIELVFAESEPDTLPVNAFVIESSGFVEMFGGPTPF